ncbi:glycoside hydrolase superfamily [Zopfochytrium polystomum]|nr:glycoside hydrolase superfamily [Zopfochytrium polystomum]
MALGAASLVAAQSASLPLMGWNSYNQYSCTPTDSAMAATINALADNGFVAAGYKMFQIDCGWQAFTRNATTGSLAVDATNFPRGLQPLADLARQRGLSWGMYTDQGVRACDTISTPRPGSLGHEAADAAFFASLGASYVKVDNCYVTANDNAPKAARTDFPSRFGNMTQALRAHGIALAGACQWGVPYSSPTGLEGPAQWAPASNYTSFRLSDDITNDWVSVVRISNQMMHIANAGLSGPGRFADADLLEVGNGKLTADESRSHFALWAMLKSPLFISTDVVNPSADTRAILLNKRLIAVNQDPLGAPVKLVQRWSNDRDLYAGPLANGDLAVLLVEHGGNPRTLSIDFSAQLGVASADVEDLWSGATAAAATSWSAAVGAHGNIALRLSRVVQAAAAAPAAAVTWYEAETAALADGANVQACSGCSGGKKAGYVGTLTFSGVRSARATAAVRFDYVNGDVQFSFDNKTNARGAAVSVNGGPATEVYFPVTGYNWDTDVWRSFLVELSGFNTSGANTITVKGGTYLSQYAPDFDRIGVVA